MTVCTAETLIGFDMFLAINNNLVFSFGFALYLFVTQPLGPVATRSYQRFFTKSHPHNQFEWVMLLSHLVGQPKNHPHNPLKASGHTSEVFVFHKKCHSV
jgi:hypothetical protein